LARGASKPLYVPETLTVIELLEEFKQHRQHFALVIDEFGEIQGLVTINDAMGSWSETLRLLKISYSQKSCKGRRIMAGRRRHSD